MQQSQAPLHDINGSSWRRQAKIYISSDLITWQMITQFSSLYNAKRDKQPQHFPTGFPQLGVSNNFIKVTNLLKSEKDYLFV